MDCYVHHKLQPKTKPNISVVTMVASTLTNQSWCGLPTSLVVVGIITLQYPTIYVAVLFYYCTPHISGYADKLPPHSVFRFHCGKPHRTPCKQYIPPRQHVGRVFYYCTPYISGYADSPRWCALTVTSSMPSPCGENNQPM